MKVELLEKYHETEDVISFIFKPLEEFGWKAGQFIYYKIPHDDPDGRGVMRHFTIASAPHENNIRLTTRFFEEEGSSFKKALNKLEIGNQVDAFSHEGSFIVDDNRDKYIFIAGGIGITPFRSILMDLSYRNKISDIILFYGNRDKNIVFKDELEKIIANNPGLKIQYIISPVKIDFEILDREVPGLLDRRCYISGPMKMIKSIEQSIIRGGVSTKKIKTDYFSGY